MKFICACGARVDDKTDALPHMAHLIADEDWHGLLDAIDRAIEESGPTARDKEAACMAARSSLSRVERSAYRCVVCGRVHIAGSDHALRVFQAEDAAAGESLFASGEGRAP